MLALLLAWQYGYGLAAAGLLLWLALWLYVAWRILKRRDLGAGGKILWIVVILVLPFLGLFIYFLWDAARPRTT